MLLGGEGMRTFLQSRKMPAYGLESVRALAPPRGDSFRKQVMDGSKDSGPRWRCLPSQQSPRLHKLGQRGLWGDQRGQKTKDGSQVAKVLFSF